MSMTSRSAAFALACASLAAPGRAQVEIPKVSEIIEVQVTNIDVIVTDKLGRRIHGLKKEDFELLDSGKPQEITNLSEIVIDAERPAAVDLTPGAAPPPSLVPPRRIVIFFDSASTTPIERRRVVPALLQLIRDLGPSDEAMVVSWNRHIKVHAQPTNDRAKLEKAIDGAAREMSLGSARMTMFENLIGDSAQVRAEKSMEARRRIREANSDLTESVRGLQGIITRLSGVDGRKALILISSAFSFRPGIEGADAAEADFLLMAEDVRAPELIKSLTSAANSAGVTIYTFHAQGLESGMSAADSAANTSLERVRTAGGSVDGLSYMAARTGGFGAANTNSFTRAVTQIAEDLSSYYSIGYRASARRRDGERSVSVRTRNRDYVVRARHSLIERSFETEVTDRVISALLFPASSNDLGIAAEVLGNERKKKNRFAIPIDVKIPMSALGFTRDGEGFVADVSIFIASSDASGRMSKVERYNHRIPVKREKMAELPGKYYTYGMDVDLRSASIENRFAIAVLDNVTKATGYTTVDVKPPQDNSARR
jgi:VWFA-related protein